MHLLGKKGPVGLIVGQAHDIGISRSSNMLTGETTYVVHTVDLDASKGDQIVLHYGHYDLTLKQAIELAKSKARGFSVLLLPELMEEAIG